jgi:hypothetical protein
MCQYEQLQAIYEAARLRRAWRVSRGCIDIDLPEAQLKVDQAQLDAVRPAVSCTKLSQVRRGAGYKVFFVPPSSCLNILVLHTIWPPGCKHGMHKLTDCFPPAASSHLLIVCLLCVCLQWESAARLMVAEMMILAGEAVGSLGAAHNLPLPYRGQEVPQLLAQEVLEALPEGPCRGYALRRWVPGALHVLNWMCMFEIGMHRPMCLVAAFCSRVLLRR